MFDRTIEDFGLLFRWLSCDEVDTSTIASCAVAGIANPMVIFCLPGSTNVRRTGWSRLIEPQLDARKRPCNLTGLFALPVIRRPQGRSDTAPMSELIPEHYPGMTEKLLEDLAAYATAQWSLAG